MKAVIAVVTAVVVAVIVATIWVASGSYEQTVVADPYQAGIHHDRDRHHAEQLGWQLAVDEAGLRAGSESTLAVRLADRTGAPLDGADVTFRVERPGTTRFDRSANARGEGAGRYVATLPLPVAGFWDLDVEIRRGGDSLTLGRWIHVADLVGEGVHCDAGARPCVAQVGDVRVVLELTPHPPMPLKALGEAVLVERAGAPVDGAEVSVALSMPGMYMGDNRTALHAEGGGRYAGEGVLVRCSSGRRDWVAEVVVRLPGGAETRARFPFQAAE